MPAPLAYPSRGRAWYAVSVLLYANVVSYMARIAISLVVQPIKHDLGISDTRISLLQGLSFTLFFVVMGLPCGWLADRVNRRNLLLPATLLWCAMAILGGLSASYGELFASRIFLGIGEAALVPAGFSIIADYFPPQRRGKPIAIFMGASALGVGLGTLGGGLILKALAAYPDFHLPGLGTLAPWRALFCLTALPGLLGVVALLTLEEPVRHAAGAPQAAGAARGGFLAFVRGARGALTPVYAGSALTTLAFYALVAWSVTLFVRHYHLGIPAAGLVVGVINTAVGFLAMYGGGVLGDRLAVGSRPGGRLRVAVPAMGAAVPGLLLLCLAPSTAPAWAIVGLVIANGGLYMAGGAFYPAIQDVAPNAFRGQSVAIMLFGNNLIGATLGPTLVALATDGLFHDPDRLATSLAIVIIPALVAAAVIVRSGYAEFGRAQRAVT